MDGSRFDTLARTLSTTGSRRRALAGLVAGSLGLVALRAEETAAKKGKGKKRKKRKKKSPSLTCPSGYTACGQQCFDLRDNTQHCGTCATVCSPGKDCCNGVCTNLQDDDNNCLTCGVKCLPDPLLDRPQGAICVNGTCEQCYFQGSLPEPAPFSCCRGLIRCSDNRGRNNCIPAGGTC
jgi:hypothetical protein